jgi:adenylate cyclase
MKFWKKLTLVFIAIAILSTILGIGMLCVRARIFIMQEIANTALSVASSAAVIIDPEKVRKLEETWDENSLEYKEIQNQFRMIRDQNRNAVFYVKYIYFLWHSPEYPDYLLFGVDAEENPAEFSSFGDYYAFEDTKDLLAHFKEGYAPLRFSQDPWGVWLTGYAPIFDQNGNVLGIVGVDVPERIFTEKWNNLLIFGSWAFFGSLTIAIYMALLFSKQITEPLSSLCETVKEIGKGNLKAKTHLHTHDEFNDLGVAIDEMAIGLQERDKIKTSLARYVSEPGCKNSS